MTSTASSSCTASDSRQRASRCSKARRSVTAISSRHRLPIVKGAPGARADRIVSSSSCPVRRMRMISGSARRAYSSTASPFPSGMRWSEMTASKRAVTSVAMASLPEAAALTS